MLTQIWSATDIFCHFRSFFALLPHYWPRKLKLGKNVKHTSRYSPLHMCAINQDHMMHGSWNIKCKGQSFLSFWAIFCLLTLLTTQKIKILKKWKKPWRYYHFTLVYHKWKSYDLWFLRYGAWQNFLSFWAIFLSFYPPLPPPAHPLL